MQAPALKVLMLNYEYPPLGGGAANANFYLIQELAKYDPAQLKVDLVTSHNGRKIKTETVGKTVKIHFLPIKKKQIHYWTEREILSYYWQAKAFIDDLLKVEQYDLCHSFFALPCGHLANKYKNRFPQVISLQGSDVPGFSDRLNFLNWFLKPLFRKVASQAAAVVANSQGLRELALKTAPNQEIKVIPNGVNLKEFFPKQKNTNLSCLRVLTVGRLIERKNIDVLIKAMASLDVNLKWELIVIGSGKLETELKALAKDLGVEQKVKFLGYIEHEKLPEYYCQADVFALPSENEGMSNALLEALAAGLPVIVKNTGGTLELVNGNGFVLPEVVPESIASAIKELYFNPKKRLSLGEKSYEIAKNYSWQQFANKYFSLYQEILRKKQ